MKEISLDKPIKADASFTLLDVVPAPENHYAASGTTPKVKIPQARRSIEIDQDVTDAFRKRFGNMPLGRALRILLGLQPKVAQNAWQEEEDALIKEYYPNYGGPPLAKVLDRSVDCIRERASDLGIKRVWQYKRIAQNMVNRFVKHYPLATEKDLVPMLMKRYPIIQRRAEVMIRISLKRLSREEN